METGIDQNPFVHIKLHFNQKFYLSLALIIFYKKVQFVL